MRNPMPWKAYPIFRLTIPLVAGIFLSDTFFQGTMVAAGCSIGIGVCLLGMCLTVKGQGYSTRWLFGSMAFLFLFCVGALSVQYKKGKVAYKWPSERAIYKGVIKETPQTKEKTYLCKLDIEARIAPDSISAGWMVKEAVPVNRTVLVYIAKDSLSEKLQCGDPLYFYARVSQPQQMGIPGEFDYAAYLFRQQISGTAVVFPGYWRHAGMREPLNLKQRASVWREKILQYYRKWGFSGDEFAVLSALTVGYKEELSEELKGTYQTAGVSHVLALSGMHVAILWGLLSGVMRPLDRKRLGRWMKCFFLVVILWAFAFLVGLSASVVRAVVMCMLMTMARAAGERALSFNTLAIAAFLMLLYNPFYLFDVGFQLSFLAVVSILAIYPVVFRAGGNRCSVLRYVWGVVAVSLAAQVGTAPLVIYYFAHFPIHFLLANLIVAPLAFLIIYGAVAVFIFSPFAVVHEWGVKGLDGLLWLLNNSIKWVEHLPFSQYGEVHFSLLQVCLLYFLLLLWVDYRWGKSRRLAVAMLGVLNLFFGVWFYQKQFYRAEPQVVLARSQVMNYPPVEMWQQDSIYHYKGVTICLLADNRWRNKEADRLLNVDYMYLCRGYQGKIAPLQEIFQIKKVILDASLSDYKLNLLKEECKRLGLDYIDLSQKGSFHILL